MFSLKSPIRIPEAIIIFTCGIFLSACSSSTSNNSSDIEPLQDWRKTIGNSGETLANRISAGLTGIEEDECFHQAGDHINCDFQSFSVDISFVDNGFLTREAILIVDELVPAVEMLRDRNRILGNYRVESNGKIAPVQANWYLPLVFGDIVTAFASSPFIPSEDLIELGVELEETYSDHVPVVGSHGLAVYNILSNLVPNHPIVFLDNNLLTFNQSMPEVFCAVDSTDPDDGNLSALREHSEQFSTSLQELLVSHNIRFINASFGYTIETIRGPWPSVCETELPDEAVLLAILEAYRPIFDVLFNTDGVFTAHAGFESPNNTHFPYDQVSPGFPNRLRVGVLAHNGSDIPAGGLSSIPVEYSPVPSIEDADIFVNSGCNTLGNCRGERPLSLAGLYGMGRITFPIPQTSFSTPLLLAHFIYKRNQPQFRDLAMDNNVVSALIGEVVHDCNDTSGICIYIDPLLHEQFEE